MIVKVKGTDEILGGYNPLAWDNTNLFSSGKWMETKDSFIFSLKNCIRNSIHSSPKEQLVLYAEVIKINLVHISI